MCNTLCTKAPLVLSPSVRTWTLVIALQYNVFFCFGFSVTWLYCSSITFIKPNSLHVFNTLCQTTFIYFLFYYTGTVYCLSSCHEVISPWDSCGNSLSGSTTRDIHSMLTSKLCIQFHPSQTLPCYSMGASAMGDTPTNFLGSKGENVTTSHLSSHISWLNHPMSPDMVPLIFGTRASVSVSPHKSDFMTPHFHKRDCIWPFSWRYRWYFIHFS